MSNIQAISKFHHVPAWQYYLSRYSPCGIKKKEAAKQVRKARQADPPKNRLLREKCRAILNDQSKKFNQKVNPESQVLTFRINSDPTEWKLITQYGTNIPDLRNPKVTLADGVYTAVILQKGKQKIHFYIFDPQAPYHFEGRFDIIPFIFPQLKNISTEDAQPVMEKAIDVLYNSIPKA